MTAIRATAVCGCRSSGAPRLDSASAPTTRCRAASGSKWAPRPSSAPPTPTRPTPTTTVGIAIRIARISPTSIVGIETPQFSNAMLRAIASNWGVSAIMSARSGTPLSVITGVDTAFSGISNQRANQVSDDVYGEPQEDAQGRLANYLNRAAFVSPAPGTVGTSLRNGIKGPSYWNGVNLGLRRLISLTGTQTIELRIESFNLLNSFSWGNPTTNLSSGQFGRITTQAGRPAHHAVRA